MNEMELSMIQGISNFNISAKNSNISNTANKGAVYAEKGDPTYQKEMDADEDGVITMEEFIKYCKDNGISPSEQAQMLQNRLDLQLHKDRARVSAEIKEIKSEGDAIYAKEGEDNYEEEIDANKDGKITYDEYMRYCEENEKPKEKQQPQEAVSEKTVDEESGKEQFVVKNDGKAINTYIKNENDKEQTKVEKEA